MAQTLDQKRAALAWGYATASRNLPGDASDKYRNLAKGAPALIMNSGLMPTLAFYKSKGPAEQQLLNDLMTGLLQRLAPQPVPRDFMSFMAMLQKSESRDYLRYTDEALELLKWLRQFVDAVKSEV
jgi:CRISPR-associated protein Cmr5